MRKKHAKYWLGAWAEAIKVLNFTLRYFDEQLIVGGLLSVSNRPSLT